MPLLLRQHLLVHLPEDLRRRIDLQQRLGCLVVALVDAQAQGEVDAQAQGDDANRLLLGAPCVPPPPPPGNSLRQFLWDRPIVTISSAVHSLPYPRTQELRKSPPGPQKAPIMA